MLFDRSKGRIRLQIMQDEDPLNPRTDQDNLGTMYCCHGRYTLGDKQPPVEKARALEEQLREDPYSMVLPLYLMDHGGLFIQTTPFNGPHASWDSGRIGFIVAGPDDCKRMGTDPRLMERVLLAEVEEYDQYLRGNILRYVVQELCPTCKQWHETDSCGGFYTVDDLLAELSEEAQELFDREVRDAV